MQRTPQRNTKEWQRTGEVKATKNPVWQNKKKRKMQKRWRERHPPIKRVEESRQKDEGKERTPDTERRMKTREHPTKTDETTRGEDEGAKRNGRDSSQQAALSIRETLDLNESWT